MIWFDTLNEKDFDAIAPSGVANFATFKLDQLKAGNNSIESEDLFGNDKRIPEATYVTVHQNNLRSYLVLAEPILNPVVVNLGVNLLSPTSTEVLVYGHAPTVIMSLLELIEVNVLDPDTGDYSPVKKSKLYSDILSCEIVKYKGEFIDKKRVPSSEVAVSHNLVFGARLLRELLREAAVILSNNSKDDTFKHFKGVNARDITNYKFLRRVVDDPKVVDSLFLEKLVIPPMSFRPTNKKKRFIHFLTDRIKKCIQANANVTEQLQASTATFLLQHYNALCASVYLMVSMEQKYNIKEKSVMEMLGSKEGHIRDKMISHRVDYSGRGVIVVGPDLDVDECGIPEEVVPNLYKYHITKNGKITEYKKLRTISREDAVKYMKDKNGENVPLLLNRAPTLHRLSFLGFVPKVVKGHAIQLNPLVCPGYNADFDGDSMGIHVPLSASSIAEVKGLMLPSKVRFHPAHGGPTLVPRMEMVYGLNEATRTHEGRKVKDETYTDYEDLKRKVKSLQIKVWDQVYFCGKKINAGKALLCLILPENQQYVDFVLNNEINKKTIIILMSLVAKFDDTSFKKVINEYTKIGFFMSEKYAPTCSILQEFTDTHPLLRRMCENPFEDFNDAMEEANRRYDEGLLTVTSYGMKYSDGMDKVLNDAKANLPLVLGERNGYNRLVASGARGSESNLVQIYMCKGQITKSNNETFNAAITGSYSDQLSSLEHFASTYGARQGLIDKTLKTGDTGYFARLVILAASDCVIKLHDCGDEAGIKLSKSAIGDIYSDEEIDSRTFRERFAKIIKGRYLAKEFYRNRNRDGHQLQILDKLEASDGYVATEELAMEIVSNFRNIYMRSTMTCKNGTCQKCYGEDLSTGRLVKIGTPVGIVAGQAIGEPGTQLAMRTFQKGGVKGSGNSVSAFNTLNDLLNPVKKLDKLKNRPDYDPVVPHDCIIQVKALQDETSEVRLIADGKKTITMKLYGPHSFKEGRLLKAGDSIRNPQGCRFIPDVIKYHGIGAAQVWLSLSALKVYDGQADINYKHFEVLVTSMTVYKILDSNGRKELEVGNSYNKHMIGLMSGIEYETSISGVDSVFKELSDPFKRVGVEYIKEGLSRSVLDGAKADLENVVLTRHMFGLTPNIGITLNRDYISGGSI